MQRFCSEQCRRALDGAGRRWIAEALADGRLTVDGLRAGLPATRAVATLGVADDQGPGTGSEPASAPSAQADNLLSGLADLLGDILGELSPDELAALPECVWALLDFIAGSTDTE